MFLLRLLHPQHIVKQQVCSVVRRQPLMSEPGAAHHDGPQLADLAMHSKFLHCSLPFAYSSGVMKQGPFLRARMATESTSNSRSSTGTPDPRSQGILRLWCCVIR